MSKDIKVKYDKVREKLKKKKGVLAELIKEIRALNKERRIKWIRKNFLFQQLKGLLYNKNYDSDEEVRTLTKSIDELDGEIGENYDKYLELKDKRGKMEKEIQALMIILAEIIQDLGYPMDTIEKGFSDLTFLALTNLTILGEEDIEKREGCFNVLFYPEQIKNSIKSIRYVRRGLMKELISLDEFKTFLKNIKENLNVETKIIEKESIAYYSSFRNVYESLISAIDDTLSSIDEDNELSLERLEEKSLTLLDNCRNIQLGLFNDGKEVRTLEGGKLISTIFLLSDEGK
jgi:hypothetical protein